MEVSNDREREEVCKRLGALPIIKKLMEDLHIREIVDRHCPIRECVADYTHGQMVEIFIANRLSSPKPLYRFDLWADEFAAAEIFGLSSGKLNDDRLGRTLDAVADAIDEIQMDVAVRAVDFFELSLEQAHLDITSFMFEGAYESNEVGYPAPMRGFNSEGDYSRKQVRTGQSVLKDGNVTILHKTFSGNQTDSKTLMQVFEGLEFLRAKAKPKEMVHVGDSKLLSSGNLLFLLKRGVFFVAPGERNKEIKDQILKIEAEAWIESAYISESEQQKRKKAPPENWNRFFYQEFPATILDSKTGTEFGYRKLIIRSSEEVRAARKHRERQIQKAEQELHKVANGIPRYYKTLDRVKEKVAIILEKCRVAAFFKVETGTLKAETGTLKERPYLVWSLDSEAIEKAEAVSGCYPILTSLPEERTPDEVLAIQKDEYRVESRFANWKGPLQVCPIFLHNNRRIAGLLMTTALALTIFSLIERQVRKALGDKDGRTVGFLPERRKSRPTGKSILDVLRVLAVVIVYEGDSATRGVSRRHRVVNVTPLIRRLHEVFGVTINSVFS
jgi:transposase